MPIPIRKALVALPFLLLLLLLVPSESRASSDGLDGRTSAVLVAPAGREAVQDGGMGAFGLAALVGVGLVPVFVLIVRQRPRAN